MIKLLSNDVQLSMECTDYKNEQKMLLNDNLQGKLTHESRVISYKECFIILFQWIFYRVFIYVYINLFTIKDTEQDNMTRRICDNMPVKAASTIGTSQ